MTVKTRPVAPPALARSSSIPVGADIVAACLDPKVARDQLFERAWRDGCSVLDRRERSSIAGTTGHIAESVVELVLTEQGWIPIWHHAGPGPHGIDLAFLAPRDLVVVVEVKGTLVPGRVPHLSAGELRQMSAEWVDKRDNPGMASLELDSEDVYGLVVAVNFPDRTIRVAATDDFQTLRPVNDLAEIESVLLHS